MMSLVIHSNPRGCIWWNNSYSNGSRLYSCLLLFPSDLECFFIINWCWFESDRKIYLTNYCKWLIFGLCNWLLFVGIKTICEGYVNLVLSLFSYFCFIDNLCWRVARLWQVHELDTRLAVQKYLNTELRRCYQGLSRLHILHFSRLAALSSTSSYSMCP